MSHGYEGTSYQYVMDRLEMKFSEVEKDKAASDHVRISRNHLEIHQPAIKVLDHPCSECGEPWPCLGARLIEQWGS